MRLVIEVPVDLHRAAKAKAAMEGITLRELVRRLLEDHVAAHHGVPVPTVGRAVAVDAVDAVSTRVQAPSTAKRPLPDLSKSAQSKGRMGR